MCLNNKLAFLRPSTCFSPTDCVLLLPLLQISAEVEVLGIQFGPPTTYYGEYRTYSATIIGVGVSGGFSGNINFICGSTVIAQAPLVPLIGAQIPQVPPIASVFQTIAALNAQGMQNNGVCAADRLRWAN